MRIRKFGWAAVVAAGLLGLVALGVSATPSDRDAAADSAYLFGHLHARSHSLDAMWFESSLAEMLPSQQFSVNGAPAASRTSALVIGQIADVRAGRGFSHKNDAPSSTEVGFNSPQALWRTVEVTVSVEQAWGKVAGQDKVTFAVVIDRGANATAAINGLRSLGRIVVSLDRQGRYAYSPGLYSISHSGDLFGTVDAQGNIQLPVMENGAGFMKGLDTVAELSAEAAKSPQSIKIDLTDGVPARW
ncbi:hypothetical protein Rhe02_05480 [Rhizocola hellebori]|uniref:Uncharacterized protein n=1 Tax=Rhizocola hellebori TaxID=1392758 RepID=A0A8J3Q328_9ACTN|nr:hypothetical protein [Rhizocola hellebori]GIH02481.1 hypothetical protein Rhe02_05480 [Rhizocola hellebori]